jgi:Oxysterol-binding protein
VLIDFTVSVSKTHSYFYMQGNSLMRILHIAAFAVSGYASTEGRQCKPFNPLLGETYEADYPDKGLRFFSEKVGIFYVLLLFPFDSIQNCRYQTHFLSGRYTHISSSKQHICFDSIPQGLDPNLACAT